MSTPDASASPATTIVHLLRHGEVHNPEGVLYGRRDGFHLSDRGKAMALAAADYLAGRDVTVLRSSPLERARETAAPLAEKLGLEVGIEDRVLESTNRFEGKSFAEPAKVLLDPRVWPLLWNPFRPSWGEPYKAIVVRMLAAVEDARKEAEGHEAVLVSHQLPIWTTRLAVEKRSFLHNPRSRQCTLCSVTSLHFVGTELAQVSYAEPAIDLIPAEDLHDPFSAGDAPEENKPKGPTPA
ncbi:histidine phosphatase family protein [Nocardioides sp. GY 10113]|uniref:histidine phosphatase family protein n=1 Tax=Nocardioides sp. GY 10113 TaxID=2569761 RepID=UPI0010A83D72|nr:histidine phosphatase family protein [Nocardioides sp. GY 10113]TIC89257.1 histidine phosphatase family protein [Nocardioides sp. GY 10113]